MLSRLSAGSKRPQIASLDLERGQRWWPRATARQGEPQVLVDHGPKGLPAATDLGLETDRNVVVQGQGGSHVMMLGATAS